MSDELRPSDIRDDLPLVDQLMEDPSWKATGDAALREIKAKRMGIEEPDGLDYGKGLIDGLEAAESVLERRGFGP